MTGVYRYKFILSPEYFRRALYFDTFFKNKIKFFLLCFAWILGIILFTLNALIHIEMNTAMQMCYIVLLLTVPLLVFSCESNYYRYKHSEMVNKERTIDLSKDWMKFRISGSPESEKIDIKRFNEAYEINNMFIIYRDQDLMLLLPKSVIPEKELLIIRSYISRNIGGRFFIRKF